MKFLKSIKKKTLTPGKEIAGKLVVSKIS